jgi:4'-phosphopantetheinyl transferase
MPAAAADARSGPGAAPVVVVWLVDLDAAPADDDQRGVLDPAERAKADRFRSPRSAVRWTAARAGLRSILGAELDCAPADVRLAAGAYGKPILAPTHASALRFNVAHSDALALIAVSAQAEVGVDVERRRHTRDVVAVAHVGLPAAEAGRIAARPPSEQQAAFLRAWVRHEARLKALGTGLRRGPEVRRGPDLAPADEPLVALLDLEAGPDYVAALAVVGPLAPTVEFRRGLTDAGRADRDRVSTTVPSPGGPAG